MNTAIEYIKVWNEAIAAEISYLKKIGNTKYELSGGRLVSKTKKYLYYFETMEFLPLQNGQTVKLQWKKKRLNGRILSIDKQGTMIETDEYIGEDSVEAMLFHDPWELLEHLSDRLNEAKKSKQKRLRIKRMMNPDMTAKHPGHLAKNHIHELVLRSKYNPVTYVWGPPGTGKTYTLSKTAVQKYLRGKKVLVVSHSNQAVDVLMQAILKDAAKKKQYNEGDIIRYGTGSSLNEGNYETVLVQALLKKQFPEMIKKRDELLLKKADLSGNIKETFSQTNIRSLLKIESKLGNILTVLHEKEIGIVQAAQVVGSTLAKAAVDPAIHKNHFDLIMIDEASMAYIPQIAFAATLGKRIIICGDFKQLPPIAMAKSEAAKNWLREDIFTKAGVVKNEPNGKLHPHLMLLDRQRRMHPDISSFTNRYIYGGLVGDHKSVIKSRSLTAEAAPFEQHASVLLNTSGLGAYNMKEERTGSRINILQLLLSFQVIREAHSAGHKSIGYITPYRAQASLMAALLEDAFGKEGEKGNILAATVHRFQGSERDVMVFDSVDAGPMHRPGLLLTGKDSGRLINVAMTRTKGKFIHVADVPFAKSYFQPGQIYRKLLEHQLLNGYIAERRTIGKWIRNQHTDLQWIHAKKYQKVFNDFQHAEKEIAIILPYGASLPPIWKQQLNAYSKQLHLRMLTEKMIYHPMILIDERILWLGVPYETSRLTQPPYVSARLHSFAFIRKLKHSFPSIF